MDLNGVGDAQAAMEILTTAEHWVVAAFNGKQDNGTPRFDFRMSDGVAVGTLLQLGAACYQAVIDREMYDAVDPDEGDDLPDWPPDEDTVH